MMRRWLVCVLCAAVLVLPQPVAAACGWSFVPHADGNNYSLNGVAAISATDAWAVGSRGTGANQFATLTEHWNGSRWAIVPSPNGIGNSQLLGVAAISMDDVWAVGSAAGGSSVLRMHWDGVRWTIFPAQNGEDNQLSAVSADAMNDVWAVGFGRGGIETLAMHWNGKHWAQSNPPFSGELLGLAAISLQDVWALGTVNSGILCRNNNSCALAEHFDGSRWTVAKNPNPDFDNAFNAVTAISSHDVWAVGDHSASATETSTLIEHWNGTAWTGVPDAGLTSYGLRGVSGISTSDVWTVGSWTDIQANKTNTLTEHWNGHQWTVVASPKSGTLLGVAAVSAHNVLAVGSANNHALTLRFHCSSFGN